MDLISVLSDIGRKINKFIDSPNFGGCAVIAAAVGQELQKYTEVEIIVRDGWHGNSADLNEIRNNLAPEMKTHVFNWNEMGVVFGHVLVKFKHGDTWKVFDSDNIVDFNEHDYCSGHITVEEAQAIASCEEGWNPTFRRHQIPRIRTIARMGFRSCLTGA